MSKGVTSKRTIDNPRVVSREEWIAARKELLAKEKNLTKQRDAVSAERRQLPWVKVDKEYVFDAPGGKKTLADLFEGRSQLIVYHFMFGPEWKEGCPSCSFNMDHTDAALVHLAQRDVSFAAISRATLPQIEAFKKRMGWRFVWVSSNGNEFNRDYHVSFTKEDFHTYSAYARGTEMTMSTYNYLDYVPKGRDEDSLPFTMAWIRHHDRYSDGKLADKDKPYWPTFAASAS